MESFVRIGQKSYNVTQKGAIYPSYVKSVRLAEPDLETERWRTSGLVRAKPVSGWGNADAVDFKSVARDFFDESFLTFDEAYRHVLSVLEKRRNDPSVTQGDAHKAAQSLCNLRDSEESMRYFLEDVASVEIRGEEYSPKDFAGRYLDVGTPVWAADVSHKRFGLFRGAVTEVTLYWSGKERTHDFVHTCGADASFHAWEVFKTKRAAWNALWRAIEKKHPGLGVIDWRKIPVRQQMTHAEWQTQLNKKADRIFEGMRQRL